MCINIYIYTYVYTYIYMESDYIYIEYTKTCILSAKTSTQQFTPKLDGSTPST